jgi:protein gp37
MGEKTAISWTHHTFSPWWGCVEVSPACDSCYARELAKRYGHEVWGKNAPRRFFGDQHWNEPFRWHRRAEKLGERRRVFCASMADVLEERDDLVGQQLTQARQRLWFTIANTPALDWLLLTKRPQNYRRLVPAEILALPNVWPGVTVESQEHDWRIVKLCDTDCAGPRWVSYEPALGAVDFTRIGGEVDVLYGVNHRRRRIEWIVVGGESGPDHRSMDVGWISSIAEQCRASGVALFMKQDSGLRPGQQGRIPDELWVQEFPT